MTGLRDDELEPAADPAPESPAAGGGEGALPPLVAPRLLPAFALLLLALTAAGGVLWMRSLHTIATPSLVLDGWQRDARAAALRQRFDGRLAAFERRLEASAALAEVFTAAQQRTQAWLVLERTELRQGVAVPERLRLARGHAEEAVRALALAGGDDAVIALGLALGQALRERFVAVVLATRAAGKPPSGFLSQTPTPDEVVTLRRVGGGAGEAWIRAGLHRFVGASGGLTLAASVIIDALSIERILQLTTRVPGGGPQLETDARRLVLRYRVEQHEGLGLTRRLQLLAALQADDPSYPATFSRAAILGAAGSFAACAATFERAARLRQRPQLAAANARWCRAQAEATSRPARPSGAP